MQMSDSEFANNIKINFRKGDFKMNKKIIIGVIIAIILVIAVVLGFVMTRNNAGEENKVSVGNADTENKNAEVENITSGNPKMQIDESEDEPENEKQPTNSGSKTLVVYYSAQNHTKAVAEKIAENLNADIFEIVPEEKYSDEDLNWTNRNSRVSKEHDDESLRDVKLETTEVENWEDYDTVLIGYPIWWGIAAWPVDTFVKANDFNEKIVIPFCTSASSGLGQSGELLEEEANGGNWQKGQRFRESPSDLDIKKWTDTIK